MLTAKQDLIVALKLWEKDVQAKHNEYQVALEIFDADSIYLNHFIETERLMRKVVVWAEDNLEEKEG